MTTDTLPKPNTELLRRILTGIASGELEHRQNFWHCGRAHCVAGWAEIFEAQKQGWEYASNNELFYFAPKKQWTNHPFGHNTCCTATKLLGLTEQEAEFLFDGETTFAQQVLFLNYLEKGIRLDDNDDYLQEQLEDEALTLSEKEIQSILDNPPSNQNNINDQL